MNDDEKDWKRRKRAFKLSIEYTEASKDLCRQEKLNNP